MARLKLENVTKIYGKAIVGVKGINIEVPDGAFLVVVGPSGCGKSTLLRLIAGLERPTEGKIFIDDELVNEVSPRDRNIAMVFQDYALYPHMTVKENIGFGLKMRGVSKDEIEKKVLESAKILQIEHLLARYPRELSGGQRQRVALGRAIVRKPKLFLFDEPLSNLDAKLREEMRTELLRLYDSLKTTVVYVTHDQLEAMTMATILAVLNKGEIQQVGSPHEIYNKPANLFVAGFIGTPTMNFIDGSLENGSFVSNEISFEAFGLAEKNVQEVVAGIRPEDIILGDGRFVGKIELVELLGSELFVYLKANEKTIISRTKPDDSIKKGERINFDINLKKVHFFRKSDGKRVE